jgi:hypothetical protein
MVLMVSPSAFSKNSRAVELPFAASVNGTSLEPGVYKVTWQTHSPAATVSFFRKRTLATTATGKWVSRDVEYSSNAVIYNKKPDGSLTIVEIRFAGLKGALVFDQTLPSAQRLAPTSDLTAANAVGTSAVAKPQAIRFLGKPSQRKAMPRLDGIDPLLSQPMFRFRQPLLPTNELSGERRQTP